jgi:hypothetical protein
MMDVGTSFVVPPNSEIKPESLRVVACAFGRKLGKKFRTKKFPDGSMQVWRDQ